MLEESWWSDRKNAFTHPFSILDLTWTYGRNTPFPANFTVSDVYFTQTFIPSKRTSVQSRLYPPLFPQSLVSNEITNIRHHISDPFKNCNPLCRRQKGCEVAVSRRSRCGWTGLTYNAALRKHACRESSVVCVCVCVCVVRLGQTDRAGAGSETHTAHTAAGRASCCAESVWGWRFCWFGGNALCFFFRSFSQSHMQSSGIKQHLKVKQVSQSRVCRSLADHMRMLFHRL